MPNYFDGIELKILPDGNISIKIHHKDLMKSLSVASIASNGCSHAVAEKRKYPSASGHTHFKPRITRLRTSCQPDS